MPEAAIACEGLTRRFGDLTAVDGLTLRIDRGTVFGFLGPNGAGKTTTIRLLLGLLEAHAGSATVAGCDPWRDGPELRARCGVLLEHDGLYLRLSARENLEFAARIAGLRGRALADRVEQRLASVGLLERGFEVVGEWSRGMRQKLAVARALIGRPEIIFLDEPTAGLDPVAASALRTDLRRLVADEGVTVFLTTHHLDEAEKLCEQVGILRAGRLLACGPPAALRAEAGGDRLLIRGSGLAPALPELRGILAEGAVSGDDQLLEVRLPAGSSAAPVVRAVVAAGGNVEEVRRAEPSLEDVFVRLVDPA